MSSAGSSLSLDSKESLEGLDENTKRHSWTSGSFGQTSEQEIDVVLDHFSDTSITSMEDVQEAILGVRRTILETEVSTQSRRDLVHKLIRLRIKLQDLEDKQTLLSPDELECRSHNFLPLGTTVRPPRGLYCDECDGAVWQLLQTSYQCKICSHLVHAQCLPRLRRKCVGAYQIKTEDNEEDELFNGRLNYKICPELSLVEQMYKCAECGEQFTLRQPPPRLCDYTGKWYCPHCHWGMLAISPARVVHNWDFTPHPVCQAALQYLHIVSKKPLIDILCLNPGLGVVIQELAGVAKQRELIMDMKKYLVVCRLAGEARLLRKLEERQHFVDTPDMFSLQDLADVQNGSLSEYLDGVLAVFRGHITSCLLCTAKGFICELCPVQNDKEVLFPFDSGVTECPRCQAVFHRECFRTAASAAGVRLLTQVTAEEVCPRCKRKKNKRQ